MKAKMNHLSNKDPKIILLFEDEDEISGARKLLSEHVKDFRAIKVNNDTSDFLESVQPEIVLLGLSNVNDSIKFYSRLIEEDKLSSNHCSVLLCKNKESAIAFQSCIHGLFDNYFVFQPLYEKFRLLMIINNCLRKCQSNVIIEELEDDKFDKVDQYISQIIKESSECKQSLMGKLNDSKDELEALSNQQVLLDANLSSKDLIKLISTQHIQPLLNNIEDDIKQQFDKIIADLTNKKAKLTTQSQSKKSTSTQNENNLDIKKLLLDELKTYDEQDAMPKPPQENEVVREICPTNFKVLVVEDNDIYREMLTNILNTEGYKADDASDGIKALHKIKQQDYDLILMDLFMPKLDGVNTTKNIRKFSNGRDIPVIALTGNKNKEKATRWINLGLKGYILKPSSQVEILKTVKNVLQKVSK